MIPTKYLYTKYIFLSKKFVKQIMVANCKQLCTVLQILSVSGTCVENLEHLNTMLTWHAMITVPTR